MRNEFVPHVKILLLMITPTKEDVIRDHQVGFDDFIILACSQADFEAKIYKIMGKKIAPKRQLKTAVVYRKEWCHVSPYSVCSFHFLKG